jgi:diketogulonate reductase-like aldo/keto reductase
MFAALAVLCCGYRANVYLPHKLIYPIPGSTRVEGVKEALGALSVSLSAEESKEIRQLVESSEVKGGRYYDQVKHTLEG